MKQLIFASIISHPEQTHLIAGIDDRIDLPAT
jgi:hypothetical protein